MTSNASKKNKYLNHAQEDGPIDLGKIRNASDAERIKKDILRIKHDKLFSQAKQFNDRQALSELHDFKSKVTSIISDIKSICRGSSYDRQEKAEQKVKLLLELVNGFDTEEFYIDKYANKSVNDEFLGQQSARNALDEIISAAKISSLRKSQGLNTTSLSYHSIFMGPPGTGKTTFARYFASEVKKLGILSKGHLVECSRNDLVAEWMGQTATKVTKLVKKALGGILFIDEAYALKQNESDTYGQEAIDTILKLMEDHRDNLIIILAGYEENMNVFLDSNPGLRSRIPNFVHFNHFKDNELVQIFEKMLKKEGYQLSSSDLISIVTEEIKSLKHTKHFGNARSIRNILERVIKQQNVRLANINTQLITIDKLKTLIASDLTPEAGDDHDSVVTSKIEKKKKAIDELNDLIGLDNIKQEVKKLSALIEVERMRNQNSKLGISLHMAFMGNPGTGKTTIARILGNVFKEIGVLPSGHVIEVDRGDLVAEYVGQTAIKTKQKIDEAIGGILFIDEAYTLFEDSTEHNFGQEAIDIILKQMEDHRDDLIVIFAGYNQEINELLKSNPGLQSRVPNNFIFPNYSNIELVNIALRYLNQKNLSCSDNYLIKITSILKELATKDNFSNAREVRNLIESSFKEQALRVINAQQEGASISELINTLEEQDIIVKPSTYIDSKTQSHIIKVKDKFYKELEQQRQKESEEKAKALQLKMEKEKRIEEEERQRLQAIKHLEEIEKIQREKERIEQERAKIEKQKKYEAEQNLLIAEEKRKKNRQKEKKRQEKIERRSERRMQRQIELAKVQHKQIQNDRNPSGFSKFKTIFSSKEKVSDPEIQKCIFKVGSTVSIKKGELAYLTGIVDEVLGKDLVVLRVTIGKDTFLIKEFIYNLSSVIIL